jgi:hypothetical protein
MQSSMCEPFSLSRPTMLLLFCCRYLLFYGNAIFLTLMIHILTLRKYLNIAVMKKKMPDEINILF